MADSLKFKFEFFLQPDVKYETATASELTWGRLQLYVSGQDEQVEVWNFDWSWVELLEHFSRLWTFLFNKEADLKEEEDYGRYWNEALGGIWPCTYIKALRWSRGFFLVEVSQGYSYNSNGTSHMISNRFVIPSHPFFIEVGWAMDQIANRLRDSSDPRSIDAIKAWDAVKIDL